MAQMFFLFLFSLQHSDFLSFTHSLNSLLLTPPPSRLFTLILSQPVGAQVGLQMTQTFLPLPPALTISTIYTQT